MEVKLETARKILSEMGVPFVDNSSRETLTIKLNNLEEILSDGGKIPEDKETASLFRSVSKAIQEGELITVSEKTKEAPKKRGRKPSAAGNGQPKAPKAPKAPKVIETIVGILEKASERWPAAKEDILTALAEKFPSRRLESMKSTLTQTPYDLKKKGIHVKKNEKGMWID